MTNRIRLNNSLREYSQQNITVRTNCLITIKEMSMMTVTNTDIQELIKKSILVYDSNKFKVYEYTNEIKSLICFKCQWCNKYANQSMMNIVHCDVGTIDALMRTCDNCMAERFTLCSSCNNPIQKSVRNDYGTVEGGVMCSKCITDNGYAKCNSCGIHMKKDKILELEELKICVKCTNNQLEDLMEHRIEQRPDIRLSELKPSDSFKIFGVEIEAIRRKNTYKIDDAKGIATVLRKWNTTYDGSLSNRGKEYVSIPMPQDNGRKYLNDFETLFAKKYLKIDKTCGLHVHIYFNRNLFKVKNIRKILTAYQRLEEFFFATQPRSRRNNSYCMSLKSTGHRLNVKELENKRSTSEMIKTMYKINGKGRINIHRYASDKYNSLRYYWLNLNSIFVRNTIEIRLHSGTMSGEKIFKWYKAHRDLLNYCITSDESKVKKITPSYYLNHVVDNETKEYLLERINKFQTIIRSKTMNKEIDISEMITNMFPDNTLETRIYNPNESSVEHNSSSNNENDSGMPSHDIMNNIRRRLVINPRSINFNEQTNTEPDVEVEEEYNPDGDEEEE